MQPYYNKKIPELQHIIENGKYFFLTGVSPAKPHSLRFKFQLSGVVGWPNRRGSALGSLVLRALAKIFDF